jgi:hypothetical protein
MAASAFCRRSFAFFSGSLVTSFTVIMRSALEGVKLELGIVGWHCFGVVTAGAFIDLSAFSQGDLFAVCIFTVMAVSTRIHILMFFMREFDWFVSFFCLQDYVGRTGVRGKTGSNSNGNAEHEGKSCGAHYKFFGHHFTTFVKLILIIELPFTFFTNLYI